MPLILAVEPDRRQASRIAAVLRTRPRTELVIADSAAHALGTLAGRVPDVLLTSPLLSRQDEAAIADWLRGLGPAAARVQALTIPILATSTSAPKPTPKLGVLSVLRRRGRTTTPEEGCAPTMFADQVSLYLEQASAERDEIAATQASPTRPPYAATPPPADLSLEGWEDESELASASEAAAAAIEAAAIEAAAIEAAEREAAAIEAAAIEAAAREAAAREAAAIEAAAREAAAREAAAIEAAAIEAAAIEAAAREAAAIEAAAIEAAAREAAAREAAAIEAAAIEAAAIEAAAIEAAAIEAAAIEATAREAAAREAAAREAAALEAAALEAAAREAAARQAAARQAAAREAAAREAAASEAAARQAAALQAAAREAAAREAAAREAAAREAAAREAAAREATAREAAAREAAAREAAAREAAAREAAARVAAAREAAARVAAAREAAARRAAALEAATLKLAALKAAALEAAAEAAALEAAHSAELPAEETVPFFSQTVAETAAPVAEMSGSAGQEMFAAIAQDRPDLASRLRGAMSTWGWRREPLSGDTIAAAAAPLEPVAIEAPAAAAPLMQVVIEAIPVRRTAIAAPDTERNWVAVPLEGIVDTTIAAAKPAEVPRADDGVWVLTPTQIPELFERFGAPPRPAVPTPWAPAALAVSAPAPVLEPTARKRTERSRPKPKPKPVQDEWGFFDPQQCGFAALLAKLDEITEESDVDHARAETTVQIIGY